MYHLERGHCAPAVLATRGENALAAHGREVEQRQVGWQTKSARSAPPSVGCAAAGMPADAADGSSHAREWGQTQRPMDATAHLPGAASWWRCPAIDTARAGDRDGNYEYWPHRRRAGSHRLLCVAHWQPAIGQQDTAASHPAGEESLDQRSGLLSRASPPEGEQSLREEPCAVGQGG